MKKIKFLLLLLIPATLTALVACQSAAKYSLSGTVNGAANLQVLLEQLFFDRSSAPVAIGRVNCDPNGHFTLEQPEAFQEGLYRLTIGAKKMFFVLGGDEKNIEFTGDLNTIDRMDVVVKGSEMFSCYSNIVKEIIQNGQMNEASAKAYAQKGCSPLMKAFFTLQLFGQNAAPFVEDFKTVDKALQDDMPGSAYATQFTNLVTQLQKQAVQQQQPQGAGKVSIGAPAPDISLPGPDGKTHTLSSLKGKVVLLDFWASWCRPCRMANPHVVEMYNKYKGKGFEVFSVSLDRPGQKDAWVAAIKQDNLSWDNHVSDLQFWDSAPAALYGVRSIPSTFLIDREGKIAALNPRTNLEEELLKILN